MAVGALAMGCASGQSNTEKQLKSLREELTMTQSALDRAEERLVALELSTKAEHAAAAPAAEPARSSRPTLKVVKVEPDGTTSATNGAAPEQTAVDPGSAPPANPEPEAERPLIQGEGSDLQSSLDPPRAKKSKTGHPKKERPPSLRTE
jgi:hypothetical protein